MNASEEQKQQYNNYVKQVTPTHNLPYEMFKAFLTGGAICLLGQEGTISGALTRMNALARSVPRWAWIRTPPEPGVPSYWFS